MFQVLVTVNVLKEFLFVKSYLPGYRADESITDFSKATSPGEFGEDARFLSIEGKIVKIVILPLCHLDEALAK